MNRGKVRWISNDKHFNEGEYQNGKRNGYGIYTWPTGKKYMGQFKNNNFHGEGELVYSDGSTRKGTFNDNK